MALGPGDVDYPRALLVALGLALAATLVVAASTSTAAFGAYNPKWDGASDLRGLADATGAETELARNTTRYDDVQANETVAVVLSPDRRYTGRDAARLRRFVEDGGTLVVAEDFGPHGNPLLAAVGADARVHGALLRDERHNYRSPAMPVARNVSNHTLTAGVDRLTLNHGTAVEPGTATVLVRSSGFAYLDANRNDAIDDDETLDAYPVATVEPVGDGRVIAVGDPSLFINAMLDRPGNGQFVRTLFGTHERVVLDYSHATGLPPLALALLVVRESALLQVALGVAGLAAVGAWNRGLFDAVTRRLARNGGREPTDVGRASVDELAAHLRRRHPDWDESRVRRVTEGVLKWRHEPGNNE